MSRISDAQPVVRDPFFNEATARFFINSQIFRLCFNGNYQPILFNRCPPNSLPFLTNSVNLRSAEYRIVQYNFVWMAVSGDISF